jgi:hypothetical protein
MPAAASLSPNGMAAPTSSAQKRKRSIGENEIQINGTSTDHTDIALDSPKPAPEMKQIQADLLVILGRFVMTLLLHVPCSRLSQTPLISHRQCANL